MEERWKEIEWTNGYYSVSDLGKVKSNFRIIIGKNGKKRTIKEHLVSQTDNGTGYKIVNISINGVRYSKLVHRLVAEAFVNNDCPETKTDIDHIDCNKNNNHYSNLEWVTRKENIIRAYTNGLAYETENKKIAHKKHALYVKETQSKPIAQYDKTGNVLINEFSSLSDARKELGVHITCITKAANNNTISYGYKWKWIKKCNDYSERK